MAGCPWRYAVVAALLALAACGGDTTISAEARERLAQAAAAGRPGSPAAVRQAAQERPSDPAALNAYAAAAEASGNFAEAAEANRALMQQEGRSERRLIAIGRLLLRAGDARGAVQVFGEAVAAYPRSGAAAGGLGLSYDLAGDPVSAQRAYRQGLSVTPTDWMIRSNLAVSLVSSGAALEAVGTLVEAEILPSAPVYARHNLALALVANGQMDRAIRLLRVDMGPVEARTMAEEMRGFVRSASPGSWGLREPER